MQKDPSVLIRQKEADILAVRRELRALYVVINLIRDETDPVAIEPETWHDVPDWVLQGTRRK